jgi:cysteinyl-tRNA synthetase
LAGVLGLFGRPIEDKRAAPEELVGELLDLLAEVRVELRKAKNFATADKIRSHLAELGVTLQDRPGRTEWSLK